MEKKKSKVKDPQISVKDVKKIKAEPPERRENTSHRDWKVDRLYKTKPFCSKLCSTLTIVLCFTGNNLTSYSFPVLCDLLSPYHFCVHVFYWWSVFSSGFFPYLMHFHLYAVPDHLCIVCVAIVQRLDAPNAVNVWLAEDTYAKCHDEQPSVINGIFLT